MDIQAIIAEIESESNRKRKAEHSKRQDVYNDHQRPHVLESLMNEFSPKTVREMRTCTSINLSRRMVDEMASVYKRSPFRTIEIEGAEGAETTAQGEIKDGILYLYEGAEANKALKRANQKYKLHDQCCIQVIPKNGKICLRVLAPHQYDVIPDSENPEEAGAVIVSVYDRGFLDSVIGGHEDIQGSNYGAKNQENQSSTNLTIADQQDYQAKLKQYVIWTKTEVLKVGSKGEILDRAPNPIEKLPFIDVAQNKDFEYWIRRGSGVVEFTIDFSVVLSDTVNTNRLQSYAQAVITAEKIPESVSVGPNNILFLPLDSSRPEVKPTFEFVNPQPDMKSSLDLQDRLLNYFMSSRGIDPKSVTSDGSTAKYASGLERLLAMIDRFEASQDDLDLFSSVESQLSSLMRDWYEVIRGTDKLDEKYNFGEWAENVYVCTRFAQPQIVQTQSEKEASVVYRRENGLMSRTEAIMELRGVSKDEAERIISEIDAGDGFPKLPLADDEAT